MKNKPPKIAELLLSRFLKGHDESHRLGDFQEKFNQIRSSEGKFRAIKWYWTQVLGSLPDFIKCSIYWSFAMLKNYFKTALRNIKRQKGSAFINIAGFAVGLMCCMFLFIWVKDELSYDRFHINANRVYRILLKWPRANNPNWITSASAPMVPLGLKEEMPEVEEAARFKILGDIKSSILVKYEDRMFNENQFAFGDASLFKMFTFEFIKGNPDLPFPDKNSIILTETAADKYFKDHDPIGKTVTVENKFKYTVTGVIKDVPHNCHLDFDMMILFEEIIKIFTIYGNFLDSWGLHFFNNYIMVYPNSPMEGLHEKAKNYYLEKFKNPYMQFFLQPVKDIHLRSAGIRDFGKKRGDIRQVYLFALTGIFILLIACINFVNLTTAQSSIRAKEIGMRKVVGAERKNLIIQFFIETMVFAFIALLIALCLAYILMPAFCSFSGKEIPFDLKDNFVLAAAFVTITAVSGFLSGIYPALFLSGLKPIKILKGFSGSEKGSGFFRKILVVVQSVIAVSLIICTVIVFRQLIFMQNRDLGFNKENFIYIPLYGNLKEKYELIKTELSKNPDVTATCFSSSIMSKGAYAQDQLRWEGRVYENEKFGSSRMAFVSVDRDFIEAFEIEMVKGTSFAKDLPKKINEEAIINETAAKMIGIEPIVGLPVKIPGGFDGKIIGVVKDYNYMPLQNQIGPLVISIEPPFFRFLMIKLKYDNMHSTLGYIENVLRNVEPGFPFEFHFMDDSFDAVYRSDMQMRNLVELFTVIAIFIACLGMFGLSSFSADRRRKEVGVRKILGASIPDIIRLLSSEYLVLITIANIFAWPVAYYFMNKWLQNYAYRIKIGVETFILAILISLFITVFTVSYKSFKTARANPVDSLRTE